jgi:outer membrane protein
MTIRVVFVLLVTTLAASWSQVTQASEATVATGKRPITVGAGVLWRDKPYTEFESSDRWSPFPLILYEGDRFFVRGGNAGWKFINSKTWEVAGFVEAQQDGYDESNSKILDGMDDRDPWLAAGAHVKWQPNKFGLKLAATTDVVQESDGAQITGEISWQDSNGPWIAHYSAGAVWHSKDYVDYYYGVKRSEALPGVRRFYKPTDEFNYHAGGVLLFQFPESRWLYALAARATYLGDRVQDSPIVDEDYEVMALFAIGYTFGK